jgi:hypothetical protein
MGILNYLIALKPAKTRGNVSNLKVSSGMNILLQSIAGSGLLLNFDISYFFRENFISGGNYLLISDRFTKYITDKFASMFYRRPKDGNEQTRQKS